MASDLLFELGTEELPSGAVWPLADELATRVAQGLKKEELSYGDVKCFASPRRLAVWVKAVQDAKAPQNTTRRGPSVNAAPAALEGFARSCGVSVEQLSQLKTDKGAWWVFEDEKPGVHTEHLLPEIIRKAIAELSIPKPMRWGNNHDEFARPVHWAALLFGDSAIETKILGVTTSRSSRGHRFHHPEPIEIKSPADYEETLKEAFVLADFNKRKQFIVEKVTELAKQHGFTPVMPDELVDEVTSIVEWPQPLMAGFETEFLDVPPEALIASMQSHQKCFALRDAQGQLQPLFITVSNIASEVPEQVIAGNEKVMRARLSDAAFFFNQDKKQSLAEYAAMTEKVVFQARLGTLKDKAIRMQSLMEHLANPLALDKEQALRAAELSKCDLMTGMVGEFPELQGLMGYYYALNDGESKELATALYEQYLPRYSGDELPKTNLGMALSLADRFDTMVGIFGINQKPTGVKDPFKLRRHALAVARMLIACPNELSLSSLIQESLESFDKACQIDTEMVQQLKPFILERMQSFYQSQGVSAEVVAAVRARQDDWLNDADKRIKALLGFLNLPEATSLASACKRVGNIIQKANLNGLDAEVDPTLFEQAEENALFELILTVEKQVRPLYLAGEFDTILSFLASLRDPVDNFFDQVMVMVDNEQIKLNRLRLLTRLQSLLQGVADISLLNVEK